MKVTFEHAGKKIGFTEKNGQWHRGVWNGPAGKSESFYFGRVADDPTGSRAMFDPDTGWLAREGAIKSGLDRMRINTAMSGSLTVSALAAKFLSATRTKMLAGDISKPQYKDYLREVDWVTTRLGGSAIVESLTPAHFTVLAGLLIKGDGVRGPQGPHARKRIIALIKAMFHWGAENNEHKAVTFGTEFVGPDTSPNAIKKAKIRAGKADNSERILTGEEVDLLLGRATPLFRAIILLSVNCGLGPADLGRIRWHHIDLANRTLNMPRGKTGEDRRGYLWKRTVKALKRVRELKHNKAAFEADGQNALIFITRKGLPMYREEEVIKDGESVDVKIANAISGTLSRMAKQAGLIGITQYRCRHTYKTLGVQARDEEAMDYMMGHIDRRTGKVYDHNAISPQRVRRVSKFIYRKLWKARHAETPTVQTVAEKPVVPHMRLAV